MENSSCSMQICAQGRIISVFESFIFLAFLGKVTLENEVLDSVDVFITLNKG